MAFFHTNFMLQTPDDGHQEDDDQNQPPTASSLIPPSCNPQQFHGLAVSILGKRSSSSVSFSDHPKSNINNNQEDEMSDDDGSQTGEKKKRLSVEQVKALEKNFELGNKLEPDRKIQLSRALGLKPRQVAIWFQNRRARWKTKQLERDYQLLSKQFEVVRAQNDVLKAQNHKLQAEILAVKNKEPTESINLNKETRDEGSSSNRSDNTSDEFSRNPSMSLFPSRPDEGVFQESSRAETQGPKAEQAVVKEESLCNMMFCGMDDQPGFWPWLQDQQNFN